MGPAFFFSFFFILAWGALSKIFRFKMVCGLLQGRSDFNPDEAALAAEDGDQLVKQRVGGGGGGYLYAGCGK